MDDGRIVERGTHEELLAGRGLYYRMARHQLKLGDDGPGAGEGETTPAPVPKNGQSGTEPAVAGHEGL